MAFDSTLSAAHALASNTPQQSFTLVAVSWSGGCPHLEIVWGGARDWVNERLKGLLVDMTLLHNEQKRFVKSLALMLHTQSELLSLKCVI